MSIQYRTIIGIDPGATGAIAVFWGAQLTRVLDIAHLKETGKSKKRINISDLVASLRILVGNAGHPDLVTVYMEQAHAMPGQGVSSMFAYGRTNGIIEGVLGGIGVVNVKKVVPAVWKRRLNLLGHNGNKMAGMEKARRLYPSAPLELAKHHNRAEAILIGHYGCLVEGVMK